MNRNGLIFIIILILVIVGIVYAVRMDGTDRDTDVDTNTNVNITPATSTPATSTPATSTPATSTPATSTPGTTAGITHTVTYTEAGFSPAVVTIKSGDTVTFKNNSARAFWPASDEHPTHDIYSEFDPRRTIPAGDSWSFTFNRMGTWKYHDHRAASLVGTVIVK